MLCQADPQRAGLPVRAIRDWLARFHDAEAGQERIAGVAVVPKPADGISALRAVNRKLVELLVNGQGLEHVTLDLDATIIGSGKREALKTERDWSGVWRDRLSAIERFLPGTRPCSSWRDARRKLSGQCALRRRA